MTEDRGVERFFRGWSLANDRLTGAIAPLTPAQLGIEIRRAWDIVSRCLRAWTPETLTQEARRVRDGRVQLHTRQSVLWRLVTHDAFHSGEISLVLGERGLGGADPGGAIDLWSGLGRIAE